MSVMAKSFSQCISTANNQARLEREDALVECFKLHKAFIGSDNCFKQIHYLKAAQKSENLSEKLKSICFYEASIFQNSKLCSARASEFKDADTHDEAIFDCFMQFQDKINQKNCIELSSKLIYPAKKDYLLAHCQNI